jgi:hypothetical protein
MRRNELDMQPWQEANQQHLSASLERVRQALARYAGREGIPRHEPENLPPGNPPYTLDRLCAAFGLSSFERDLVLLCAGVELEAAFAALVSDIQAGRRAPTFGLALAALPAAHWSALAPAASLRRWHILEPGPGDVTTNGGSLTTSPLRLDERILHFLTGIYYLDERLAGLFTPVPASSILTRTQQEAVQGITRCWSQAGEVPPAILLGGEGRGAGAGQASKAEIASAACRQLGMSLYRMEVSEIPEPPAPRELLARLWEREAVLGNYALLVEGEDLEGAPASQALAAFVMSLRSPLLIAAHSALPGLPSSRPVVALDIPRPGLDEQRQVWQAALGPSASGLNGSLDMLAAQFDLSADTILGLVNGAAGSQEHPLAGPDLAQALWDASRRKARPRLDALAQRIDSMAAWDDLVLPELQRQVLIEISAQVRQRGRVYEAWGMAQKNNRGLGISALFAGPSGTGKTLAAEVLANELRLDLFRIDLSSVVNKYIGETEKNLRRVFAAAEGSGAILLFDEADALFGKRSEVKDSHDRYANVEISYLLQRMETYRGLAILTSNLKSAIDPAFLRRIRFVVNFPFPDASQRAEIWKRMFPPQLPTEGLDRTRLAKLNVAGGNIRNIALNAAFLAADAGEPVRMRHLLRAARTEYAKLEKTLSEAEIGGGAW